MPGRLLLDTSVVIALFARETPVQARLTQAEEIFVPSIVLGELYYGARHSGRVTTNVALVEAFALRNIVLGCTGETAQQ